MNTLLQYLLSHDTALCNNLKMPDTGMEDYFYQGLLYSVLCLLFKRLPRVIISLSLPYLHFILYIIFIKNYTL